MPEHRIRFRAGWEVQATQELEAFDRFTTLPIHWPADLDGPVRMIRRFGRPRSVSGDETYRIELLRVPGLVRLSLNGHEPALSMSTYGDFVVSLVEPLLDRNTLIMEVELGQVAQTTETEEWGAISLVIVSESIDEA